MADMYQLVLVLALTCLLSSSVNTTDTNYRLNTPIVPSQYQILITPYFATGDANQFTFDGTVSILFKTAEITNQIKLHSEDLTITPDNVVVVIYNTGATIGVNTANGLEFNTTYTFAYINLDSSLEPGVDYVLQI